MMKHFIFLNWGKSVDVYVSDFQTLWILAMAKSWTAKHLEIYYVIYDNFLFKPQSLKKHNVFIKFWMIIFNMDTESDEVVYIEEPKCKLIVLNTQ